MDEKKLKQDSLKFHEFPYPGKIQITPTKPLISQKDLALSYSPGVAYPCIEIVSNPSLAYKYTSKSNLVAVISNGTAVLGLGNIGALASKPVMEGKGVLFKKFAGIDVFDIEINEINPNKLVDIIASLEPTFGGINLEDIKAPECFYIEKKLRKKMSIPVFHDDQHGTAIISAAAILNGLRIVNKKISKVKLVVSGAGAASIACMNLLVKLGLKKDNIVVCDSKGVIYFGRDQIIDDTKLSYAIKDDGSRTLRDVISDADIFLGCSAPGVLTVEMLKSMSDSPLVLALANPDPEISPKLARLIRPDAIICTGRSDYPNQVNNVLCFPFIFRGALDVGATTINEEMKLACVKAIADLALAEQNDLVTSVYGNQNLSFGLDYIIPKPFDPRLILNIAPEVAKAAMKSNVATRKIKDFNSYKEKLNEFIYSTHIFMKPIFSFARKNRKRIILTEGEEKKILYATQELVSLGLAYPILIGRTEIIRNKIKDFGLKIEINKDFGLIDYEIDCELKKDLNLRFQNNFFQEIPKTGSWNYLTLIGSLILSSGRADGMICGAFGNYYEHFFIIKKILGLDKNVSTACTINALMLPRGNIFIADTYINENPTSENLLDIILMASKAVKHFGINPKIALLSHSNLSSSIKKINNTLLLVKKNNPNLEIMSGVDADAALIGSFQNNFIPTSSVNESANLLIMPNMETARTSYNLLRVVSSANMVTVGPILMGVSKPVHILTPVVSVRKIVNMVSFAASKKFKYV